MVKEKVQFGKRVAPFTALLLAIAVACSLSLPANALASDYAASSASGIAAVSAASQQAEKSCTATKTVKKQDFTNDTATIEKKAAKAKTGTNKFKATKGYGYVKFKATKSKKYSFKFSGLSSNVGTIYSAFVEVQKPDSSDSEYSWMTKVSTKGGKGDTLWLAQKGHESKSGSGLSQTLSSRTGKITLKKGQSIYFYFNSLYKNTKFTLKVS